MVTCSSLYHFFLIGAPLGAIIRKGGFGMPVIVSVGFFITYHIVSVTAEKMVKESEISVTEGMWDCQFYSFTRRAILEL